MTLTESEKGKCVKCGFSETYQKSWNYEFKHECFGYSARQSCGWEDTDVKEHLHRICPKCGYTIAIECNDYKPKEVWSADAATGTAITPSKPASVGGVPQTIAPVKQHASVTPIVSQTFNRGMSSTFKPAEPAKCGKCPCEE